MLVLGTTGLAGAAGLAAAGLAVGAWLWGWGCDVWAKAGMQAAATSAALIDRFLAWFLYLVFTLFLLIWLQSSNGGSRRYG